MNISQITRPMERSQRKDTPRVNEEITCLKVRLVNEQGEMVGIVSAKEALQQAYSSSLDLVEVSPQADPPVCKILNYGKFKYEQQKNKNEAKKKQKTTDTKEVQMRPMIDDNDFDVKCRSIKRFLEHGDKVKIVVRFRGREISHQDLGREILQRVRDLFETTAKIESPPALEGRSLIMLLGPK